MSVESVRYDHSSVTRLFRALRRESGVARSMLRLARIYFGAWKMWRRISKASDPKGADSVISGNENQ